MVVIRDPNYNSEATVEIYAREITIKTAWSNYTYRLFVLGDNVGVSTMVLIADCWNKIYCLPSLPGKVCWSPRCWIALCTERKRELREYAEDNLKLKKFRRENFNEDRTGVAHFDHPKRVYDEFIKEDYVVPSSDE